MTDRVATALAAACLAAAAPLSAAAAAGGNLVIAFPADQEPASLDGQADPYQSTWLFDSFMADPLLVQDSDGKYKPDLAMSWEASPDGKDWTFKLRPGLTFQDGTALDATAVKFNLDRVVDPKTASAQMASDVGPITSTEVLDPLTVRLHYDVPWVTLLDAVRRMPIWSPAAVAKWGKDFDKHLVGAGPFTFVERVSNDHIAFKKWPGYGGWNAAQQHPGPAYLDSLTIRFIGEKAVLGSIVANGEAQIGYSIPAQYAGDYKGSGYKLLVQDQPGVGLQMVMNIRKPPFDQLKVRQALLYGEDMPAANKLLYDGTYAVVHGPLTDSHPCFWPGAATAYPHDPEKAKALLDAAGWKLAGGDPIRKARGVSGVADGTPLKIRYTVLHHQEIGEALQAQLRTVGIDLAVEVVPGPVQLDRVNKRDFELIYERQRSLDPLILDQIWNSKWDKPGGWAWTGFKDATLDGYLDQLRAKPDIAARCATAQKAQEIILANALMLPTLSDPVLTALTDKVSGYKPGAEGIWFYVNDVTVAP